MRETIDFIRAKRKRIKDSANVMCGACKATGLKHGWNAEYVLSPVRPTRKCEVCNGTGRIFDKK